MRPVIRQKRLYEEITKKIHDVVVRDGLKPGDRLPPERQLAEVFHVSRNSVREAIKSLEQHGILISKPGAGTFVAEHDQAVVTQALELVFTRERRRLEEIFELRLLLEPQIAALAAQRITNQDCQRLDDLIRAGEDAIAHTTPYHEHDLAFHEFIAACTGNHALIQLMEKIQDMLVESRDEALQSPNRIRESLEGHKILRNALVDRDPIRAQAAMETHLRQTRNLIFTTLCGETAHERHQKNGS